MNNEKKYWKHNPQNNKIALQYWHITSISFQLFLIFISLAYHQWTLFMKIPWKLSIRYLGQLAPSVGNSENSKLQWKLHGNTVASLLCVYSSPHVLGQAQYSNGETRWTGKSSLECQNHEVSDTKHPFFVIYIWTDHCNPFNWSPTHSTGPQSIQLVPKFQYWLIHCQNGQFWQNKLILSFHCVSPQPSQVVPGSFNWSSPHSTGPQVPVLAYSVPKWPILTKQTDTIFSLCIPPTQSSGPRLIQLVLTPFNWSPNFSSGLSNIKINKVDHVAWAPKGREGRRKEAQSATS